jgi:hypothetical protein
MSNFYVPTDISNLIDFLPPSDDIIYSTLCKIKFSISYRSGTSFKSVEHTTRKVEYNSHLLITQNGFAYYYRPYFIKKYTSLHPLPTYSSEVLNPLPTYNTLLNITEFYGSRRFRVRHLDYSVQKYITPYDFEIIPHSDIESDNEFEQRRMKFKPIMYKQMLNTTQSWLNYIIENKDEEVKAKPPLWKADFIAQKYDQSSIKDFIESETSHIDSNRKKRKKERELLNDIVNNLNQKNYIAYFRYIAREGEIKPSLSLRKFKGDIQDIFNTSYIKMLRRTISKQKKYLRKVNK